MISVADIVGDYDLQAPKPFQILRSSGQWTLGGFTSTTSIIPQVGPVQRASDKEVQMLPEGDRVGGVMAFWCTIPVYTTRGQLPDPSVLTQTPQGTLPGTTFSVVGVTDGSLYINGLLQLPGIDYTLASGIITTTQQAAAGSTITFTSAAINDMDSPAAADILVYPPGGEQYRVLSVRHYPGSGYWKALGTRMSAI